MQHSHSKCLPLDQRQVTILNRKSDELEQRPVLHPDLCQLNVFSGVLYRPINVDPGENEQDFIEMLDAITTDLHWLLSLNHEKFWCQVVNDLTIHACLDSYLRHAPRYKQPTWPQSLTEKHNFVHRLVFMVFLRMSTLKESAVNFISREAFAQIIYDSFLFDIPRLMDICSLYGVRDNQPLLKKMLDNIFQCQPEYYNDLEQASKTVVHIFGQIEDRCNDGHTDEHGLPHRLTSGPIVSPLLDIPQQELKDIILYLSDTVHTLESFIVDVFSDAGQSFYKAGILEKLSSAYSIVLVKMRNALRERQSSLGGALYHELRAHIRQSCDSVIKIVDCILKNCIFNPVLKAVEENNVELVNTLAEEYFNVLSSLLADHRFIGELDERFNIRKDVEMLMQACPQVGDMHSAFLFQAFDEAQKSRVDHVQESADTNSQPLVNGMSRNSDKMDVPSSMKDHRVDDAKPQPVDVETASLISSVCDLLPDLGVGFVSACLRHFDFNPEKVIQVILDGNLPDHLEKLDRTATEIQVDAVDPGAAIRDVDQPSTSKQANYLSERKNIFDNDEFDVLGDQSNIDMSKVHRGKRDNSKLDHWREEEGMDVEKLRNLYSRYGLAHDAEDDFRIKSNPNINYEDEYDDTYDDITVVANDADSADELMEKKKYEESEENQEEAKRTQGQRNRRDFVENPEMVRARNEARRQQREEDTARRGGRSKRMPVKDSQNPTNEKNNDRKRRDYKSTRGNHSHKSLAAKKASKGMFMTQ